MAEGLPFYLVLAQDGSPEHTIGATTTGTTCTAWARNTVVALDSAVIYRTRRSAQNASGMSVTRYCQD